MPSANFKFSYDGEALKEHTIDVRDLAPALLALGDIFQEVNKATNPDGPQVNVLVRSHFQQQCFLIDFIIQALDTPTQGAIVAGYLGGVKELIDWVVRVFDLYKVVAGRAVTVEKEEDRLDQIPRVALSFGDNTTIEKLVVEQHTYNLYENSSIQKSTAKIFEPLRREGVDKATIIKEDGTKVEYDKGIASDIIKTLEPPSVEEIKPQEIEVWLRVRSPKYDDNAKTWQFRWGQVLITADISKTTLAEDAHRRGGVGWGEMYRVRMQIIHRVDGSPEYNVIDVLEIQRAPVQLSLTQDDD